MAIIATCVCGQDNRLPKKKVAAGSKVICGACKTDLVISNQHTASIVVTTGQCDGCDQEYDIEDSDADHPKQFCSSDCEDADDDN